MEDLQLNISAIKKVKKKVGVDNKNAPEYKFMSKPKFIGKTIARKRPQNLSQTIKKLEGEAQKKVPKPNTNVDLSTNLRDLSENKGKYQGKNYQEINDDLQLKQKPRSGGWISSLFKNNPDVPRIGQRAVKPLTEKVFAGTTFTDLDIHPHSVANLQQNLGLKELMTVQQNAIPIILQGRDILIRSQTGSGKTLAYALPIVEGLQAIRPKINRHDGIMVVVVVPTRELAVQTYELFLKLVKPFTWVVPGLLSGGQKRKAEKARLRKGLSILVGTPGRINDHLRHTKSLNFAKTGCLVLDEADRLLDMGYEKDVAAIVKSIEDHKKAATYDPMALIKQNIKKDLTKDNAEETIEKQPEEKNEIKHHLTEVFLSKQRQTILLSATLTKAVENLAGITLVDPVFVDTSEGRAVVADSLKLQRDDSMLDQVNITNMNVTSNENNLKCKNKPVLDDKVHNIIPEDNVPETKKGLKAFSGLNYSDLFLNDNETQTSDSKILNNVINQSNVNKESDSDSDYEYFKVQKELAEKTKKVESDEEDVKPSNTGNTFEEAVKTAIVEDELILPSTVNQTFLIVPMKLRLVTLCSLIVEHCVLNKKGGKMIVFMATLEMVDYHSELIETVLCGKNVKVNKKKNSTKKSIMKKRKLENDNDEDKSSSSSSEFEIDYEEPVEGGLVPVELEMFSLHGSMPHEQRMEVFKQFRVARNGVLICT
ncbi:LOW QUALITY PROTEIN: probable ATP-dependent RNA helicase CG8611, partial [Galleria mellonella]|uniref:ATP-dependent RNA helicase n=1 Tax=Galleria mellonella TaxID=7137 RepID=A0ABM3MQQ9_GALME